ncbi:MAG: DUF6340 family protein [Bacteroidaceae bacterium]|nr:DUF6340 family protein [Bacteroidaceae bacterium]
MKKGLLLLLLGAVVASCSTASLSAFQFEQLTPASISLPNEIRRVAIVDRLNDSLGVGKQALPINSKRVVESLGTYLADADYFDDVIVCDSDISAIDRNDSIINPLSQDAVQDLTRDLNANMLITIENVNTKALGSIYRPMADIKALARVYVPSRKGPFRSLAVSDTIEWEYLNSTSLLGLVCDDVTSYIAEKLAHQLAPYWEMTERYYFTGGNAYFRDADMFIHQGDWETAAEQWEEYLHQAKGLSKQQTRFNLILAKEMTGDPDGAYKDCLELLAECKPESSLAKLALFYSSLLKNRIASHQTLNLQMKRFD